MGMGREIFHVEARACTRAALKESTPRVQGTKRRPPLKSWKRKTQRSLKREV